MSNTKTSEEQQDTDKALVVVVDPAMRAVGDVLNCGRMHKRKDIMREMKKLWQLRIAGGIKERDFKELVTVLRMIYDMMMAEAKLEVEIGDGDPMTGLAVQVVSSEAPQEGVSGSSAAVTTGVLPRAAPAVQHPPAAANGKDVAASITGPIIDARQIKRVARRA